MHKCKCNIQWELIKNSASVFLYFRAALQPVHQMRGPFTEEKIRCECPSRRRRSDARALHGGLIGRTAAEVQRRSAPNPPAFQRWTQPSSPACKPTALCTSQHSVQKHPQLRLHPARSPPTGRLYAKTHLRRKSSTAYVNHRERS